MHNVRVVGLHTGFGAGDKVNATDQIVIRKLTPEERQEALETLKRVRRHAAELLGDQIDKSVPTSAELLREAREQRDREMGW